MQQCNCSTLLQRNITDIKLFLKLVVKDALVTQLVTLFTNDMYYYKFGRCKHETRYNRFFFLLVVSLTVD